MERTESAKQFKDCIGFMLLFESKYLFYIAVKEEKKTLKNHFKKISVLAKTKPQVVGQKRLQGLF